MICWPHWQWPAALVSKVRSASKPAEGKNEESSPLKWSVQLNTVMLLDTPANANMGLYDEIQIVDHEAEEEEYEEVKDEEGDSGKEGEHPSEDSTEERSTRRCILVLGF